MEKYSHNFTFSFFLFFLKQIEMSRANMTFAFEEVNIY